MKHKLALLQYKDNEMLRILDNSDIFHNLIKNGGISHFIGPHEQSDQLMED